MKRRPLTVERLEDRANPVVWNNPWADPGHLTLSFAPDGTDVRGAPSRLFAELADHPDWQAEVLRAFQTWAAQANINIAVVPDAGLPFGTPGPVQGSSDRGDIRIGATTLADSQLAVSTPFDLFGGWTGTVLLNATQEFIRGEDGDDEDDDEGSGAFDLYTVLLQEAGHVLGLGNSPREPSAMFTQYRGPRDGLHTTDVADIQTLYGAREPDRFEGKKGNEYPPTATRLSFVTRVSQLRGTDGTSGSAPLVAAGDVTTLVDADTYSVRVPAGVRSFTASLRTTGVSLLTARLTVLDATGRVVGSAVATDPTAGDLAVTVTQARPGTTYFVRVEGADDDVFGIGGYRLAVGTAAAQAVTPPNPTGLLNDDGRSARPAVNLGNQREGPDRRWDATYRASITTPADTDVYRVRSKKGSPGTLVVAVWALEGGRLDPRVTVYDKHNRPVPAEVLTDDAGSYTVQVRNAQPNSTYSVRVGAADRQVGTSTGNYFLGVDFRDQAVTLDGLSAGILTVTQPAVAGELTVHQDQLLHFALDVVTANRRVESAVRVTIRDATGRDVFTLLGGPGGSASGDVLLAAGTYQVIVAGGTRDAAQGLPALQFRLSGLVRSDPIGITPEDTRDAPAAPPPPPPPPTISVFIPYFGPYTRPYRPA